MEESVNTLELNLAPQKVDAIHRALLSGLLGNIATRGEANEYLAARGAKCNLFPGSGLFKRKPAWIMSAELVETTRLYARIIAPIQPQWAERLAGHLVKRIYTEPHWQPQSSHVAAFEKVTLYGLTLIPRRSVHYGPIEPEISRQLFIYHALALGDYRTRAEFFIHNRALIEQIRTLEAKRRQRDLLVDDQAIYNFYDKRIPPGIYNGPLFEKWRQHTERGRPTLLFMQRRDLLTQEVEENKADYPDSIEVSGEIDGLSIPLSYAFDPSDPADGVTARIPLAVLNQVSADRFEWLVPGFLREKVIALMKTMPKSLRVKFVPVPEHADRAIDGMRFGEGSLYDALAQRLGKLSGEPTDRTAFAPEELPPYLLMNFAIIDDTGEVTKTGRNLDALRRDLGVAARKTFQTKPSSQFDRDNITSWDFDDLPSSVQVRRNGMTLLGYPALVDSGESVSLRLFDNPDAASHSQRAGVRRLLMLQLREEVKWLSRKLPGIERMTLHYAPLGNAESLKTELVDAILDRALFDDASEIRTRQQFLDRAQLGWRKMSSAANEMGTLIGSILEKHHALRLELDKVAPPALIGSYQDMRRHLSRLIYADFIPTTPPEWLPHLPRFVASIEIRLRKLLNAGLNRDVAAMNQIAPLQKQLEDASMRPPRDVHAGVELETYRWMLEELRVSLFAQELKTSIPISIKRLEAQWGKVNRSLGPPPARR